MQFLKSVICAGSLLVSSVAVAGPILIINGANQTTEVDTTLALTDNLKVLHEAVGNTVTIVDDLLADLSAYSQIWDVRFFNAAALNSSEQTAYSNYLVNGGGLFLMGENGYFMERNNSVLSLISSLGGGDLGFNDCQDGTQQVHAPFTGPNDVAEVTYALSGCFSSKGTGQWITSRADGSAGSGVAFAAGSLSNAMAGALTTILDVNFMMNEFDLPNSQQLTKNLIAFVGEQTQNPSNPVPAPATVLMLATALAALRLRRKQQ